MDRKTLKMIEDRKRLFVEEGGRTEVWKEEKKRTDIAVKARKRKYFDRQKDHLLAEDANRNFYKYVRNFGKAERPRLFDVRDLMPAGQTDVDSAEQLAGYFNRISNEFEPLRYILYEKEGAPCARTVQSCCENPQVQEAKIDSPRGHLPPARNAVRGLLGGPLNGHIQCYNGIQKVAALLVDRVRYSDS